MARRMRALLLALACAALSGAQTRPDFSGSWTLNLQQSDIDEPHLKGAVFTIEHREPNFAITRTLLYPLETKNMKFALRTDGKPLVVPYGEEKLAVSLRWETNVLVCSIRDALEAENSADRVEYALSHDRKRLTVRGREQGKPRVWIFDRR